MINEGHAKFQATRGLTLSFQHWLRQELKSEMVSVLPDFQHNPPAQYLYPVGVKHVWDSEWPDSLVARLDPLPR